MNVHGVRSKRGTTIAELGGIIFAFLFLLAFPFIDLCTVGMRTCMIIGASRDAAASAAKSLTYLQPAPPSAGPIGNNTPAVQIASASVQRYIQPFGGIKVSTIKVGIVIVDNKTGSTSGPFYNPLASVDQFANTYYLDISVKAEAEPIAKFFSPILGAVPGISAPLIVDSHSQRMFENPKGLVL